VSTDNPDQKNGRRKVSIKPYHAPAGGWGSVKGMAKVAAVEATPYARVGRQLWRQNKSDGFACVSCAWGTSVHTLPFEFCENGAKATLWEMTGRRCTPGFMSGHTLTELRGWTDFDLEQVGRITHPMRYDPASDRYVEASWEEAFTEIGRELKALEPKSVVFYASGRASLETSYMYGLMARLYGNQNLPDSSNMCHETTSVGLKQSLGSPVGTVVLEDFEACDAIFFFGQNVGSNSPRLLHDLQKASRRGVPIVTFNPLKERGLERFVNPQDPVQMLTQHPTRISSQYHQVKAGGDIAVITGLCKLLLEWDDQARAAGEPAVVDHAFIAEHAHGFDAFAAFVRSSDWPEIELESGLSRAAIEEAARVYAQAKSVIGIYGMGLTQHVHGISNVHMVCNLLLLRGNIGRPGAGACPVRGHSNVQGQRTVGITEKTELAPIDRLRALYGFEPPTEKGLNTVETCEGVLSGEVQAFIGLGGNFISAIPDTARMEAAWPGLRLSVQIATRLNRSHLFPGEVTWLLPCLGRTERDVQATGPQRVSVEDSLSCIHASFGEVEPPSPHLLSEAAIVAGIAKATLPPNPKVDWDAWVGDYARVRDAIEATYPQWFKDFNARFDQPGGFHRPNKARQRDFSETETGKANFFLPRAMSATGFADADGVMRLITLRSNDQFNTTIYGYSDRFRGIEGTREVLLMNRQDMARLGLTEGQTVSLASAAADGIARTKPGLRVTPYDIPLGCVGGYYPECNVLMPLSHHALESFVPAAKSVPVRVVA
jgi:molybdopterin-dependent oxidoreductase alpha subunit